MNPEQLIDEQNKWKHCCPMCRHEFTEEEIKDKMKCPRCKDEFEKDQLIGEWDDCGYDL